MNGVTMTVCAAMRAAVVAVAMGVVACRAPVTGPAPAAPLLAYSIVPNPATIDVSRADSFLVAPRTPVFVAGDASPEVAAIGTYAANLIASHAGDTAQRLQPDAPAPDSSISLTIDSARAQLGAEGYELTVTKTQARIVAAQPAGLFHGVQTLRQLLPVSVEHQAALNRRLTAPAAHIIDVPRYEWRGAMLDVARHFLPPQDVKRFIDYLALYKFNRLHLHLADDQGWRIEIKSWPRLAEIGGKTQAGGGEGGYYTQE